MPSWRIIPEVWWKMPLSFNICPTRARLKPVHGWGRSSWRTWSNRCDQRWRRPENSSNLLSIVTWGGTRQPFADIEARERLLQAQQYAAPGILETTSCKFDIVLSHARFCVLVHFADLDLLGYCKGLCKSWPAKKSSVFARNWPAKMSRPKKPIVRT